jgi:hypothetical protein
MPHPDLSHPLSVMEKNTFGHDAKRHPVIGFVLEQGSGAGTPDQQAENYCKSVDADEGRDAGNELRRKCGLPVAEDIAAEAARVERDRAAKEKAAYAALEQKPVLEARIAALEAELAAKSTVH